MSELKKYHFEDSLYTFLNIPENERNKKYSIDDLKVKLLKKYNSKNTRYLTLSSDDCKKLKLKYSHYQLYTKIRISMILESFSMFLINTNKIDNSYNFFDELSDLDVETFMDFIKKNNTSYLIKI